MSTTPTIVREALVTLIEALTPTSLATEPFARYELDLPFDAAMGQGPAHCFRKFDLRFGLAPTSPIVVSPEKRMRYPFLLAVAYPRSHYKTLTTPVLSIDQVLEEDGESLRDLLQYYTGAAYVADEATFVRETDEATGVTFLRFGALYELWRS